MRFIIEYGRDLSSQESNFKILSYVAVIIAK